MRKITTETRSRPQRRRRELKVSRTFRLAKTKIAATQRLLGTKSATETIERALDLVVFRHELIQGTQDASGIHIDPTGP